jgi:hypothetical protein
LILAISGDTIAAPYSIRELTVKLQRMPAQYHWVLADEALLLAISRGEPIMRGIRGRRLSGLVKASQRLGLLWPLLLLVGMVELVRLLLRQRTSPRNEVCREADYPMRFFVGFGAGPEEQFFKLYCEEHPGKVARLDQIDISSFAYWHHVGVIQSIRALAHALATARKAVTALPFELTPWRSDFLTYAGMRAGYFAYMSTWFEILRTKAGAHLEEIVFLAADTAAFAAADVKLPICYHQHGLISYNIQPDFTRVASLTSDEATFLQEVLPKARINLCPGQEPTLTPRKMTREILLASIYGDTNYMSSITPVIAWARMMKTPLRVRPHPCEKNECWTEYEAGGVLTIERTDTDFIQAMNRIRPRLVVSWFSTALAEALEYGVVPITVCAEDDRYVAGTVYPLFRRSLRWPQDVDTMARLLDDDKFYASVISRLREG